MLEQCLLCQTYLINGTDGKQQIEYTEENKAKFIAGEITLEQLNETAQITYTRTRLCPNQGNQNKVKDAEGNDVLLNPPCGNYYGIRGGTLENPDVIVETIKIIDN
ncbi:MAG: hypothetical protein ACM3KR_00645 [Deltaproteobacteria bacterium]